MAHQPEPAVAAVIANCKRLIADARLLVAAGSAGSALSLAILAFEEAGKGHRQELGWNKTKRTPSWHQYRQVVAAFVLHASLFQKYGLTVGELPEHVVQELARRAEQTKTLSELSQKEVPPHLRELMREAVGPRVTHLSPDAQIIAGVEFRWIGKAVQAAFTGDLEALRQRGMYVDIENGEVTSDPAAVKAAEAYRWIVFAERILLLLETGDFRAPYSEFAATLEAQVGSVPNSAVLQGLFSDQLSKMSEGQDPIQAFASMSAALNGVSAEDFAEAWRAFKTQADGVTPGEGAT